MAWIDVGNGAAAPILAVPVGSCEQHGPHLPLDTDTRLCGGGRPRSARRGSMTRASPPRSASVPAASTTGLPAPCRSGSPRRAGVDRTRTLCPLEQGCRVRQRSRRKPRRNRQRPRGTPARATAGAELVAARAGRRRPRRPHRNLDDARHPPRSRHASQPRPARNARSSRSPASCAPGRRALNNGVLGDPTHATERRGARSSTAGPTISSPRRSRPSPCGPSVPAEMTRYVLDLSTRVGAGGARPVVLGGSPLRLFRLTATGGAAFDRVRAGDDVPD